MSHVTRKTVIDPASIRPYDKLVVSYEDLEAVFGDPRPAANGADVVWVVTFDDGLIAAVYNWRNGLNHLGPNAPPIHQLTNWTIAGTSRDCVHRIRNLLQRRQWSKAAARQGRAR
ncbi:MAG: hypothetical protein HQL38_08400 [Alphaproteobacteria bacterium]|nr:hypothetical protein [Alphaproteobacteria bacterium]